MRIKPSVVAILLGLATTGAATTLAYLTPSEVFSDLEVEETPESSSEASSSVLIEAEDSAEEEGDAQGQSVNPFEQEQSAESAAMPAQQQDSSREAVSSAPAQDTGKPTFYRSGEEITPSTEPPKENPTPAQPQNVFEHVSSASSESSVVVPEPTVMPDEEIKPEAEPEPEAPPAAEPSESLMMRLLGQMKYLIGAIGLAIAGGLLFIMKKKPSANPEAPAAPQANDVPAGPDSTMVEESSERLEHALNTMDSEEKQ